MADTLPEWLHHRFRPDFRETWDTIGKDGQDYWAHEAEAVRRAVARNGFKQPKPAICIRCKQPVTDHAEWCAIWSVVGPEDDDVA